MKFATLYLLSVNMTGLLSFYSDFITQQLYTPEESLEPVLCAIIL